MAKKEYSVAKRVIIYPHEDRQKVFRIEDYHIEYHTQKQYVFLKKRESDVDEAMIYGNVPFKVDLLPREVDENEQEG